MTYTTRSKNNFELQPFVITSPPLKPAIPRWRSNKSTLFGQRPLEVVVVLKGLLCVPVHLAGPKCRYNPSCLLSSGTPSSISRTWDFLLLTVSFICQMISEPSFSTTGCCWAVKEPVSTSSVQRTYPSNVDLEWELPQCHALALFVDTIPILLGGHEMTCHSLMILHASHLWKKKEQSHLQRMKERHCHNRCQTLLLTALNQHLVRAWEPWQAHAWENGGV